MNNIAPTMQKNCDTQNCLQNHKKNAKTTKFFYNQPTLPNNTPAMCYLSTMFRLSFIISCVALPSCDFF